ncbi:acrB/AcrD/AcrF family protein, partial [Vibrio parahaemolyticus V-223/04]
RSKTFRLLLAVLVPRRTTTRKKCSST